MTPRKEIVVTGMGVVSPIGIGKAPFWTSLAEGRGGIRRLDMPVDAELPPPIGGIVADFDPKQYVRPRKSLKVMSRDIQLAFAAADLACVDAGLRERPIEPERLGVLFGAGLIGCDLDEMIGVYRACIVDGKFDFQRWGKSAMGELFPLWMLKYLPNMPACHIGIGQDARGPNNSLTLGDVSSLSAMIEAVRVLQRGQAVRRIGQPAVQEMLLTLGRFRQSAQERRLSRGRWPEQYDAQGIPGDERNGRRARL